MHLQNWYINTHNVIPVMTNSAMTVIENHFRMIYMKGSGHVMTFHVSHLLKVFNPRHSSFVHNSIEVNMFCYGLAGLLLITPTPLFIKPSCSHKNKNISLLIFLESLHSSLRFVFTLNSVFVSILFLL